MDAEYYFVTGREVARGQGLVEPFLWNYLDDPVGLPHPSYMYWMPLTSLMAASAMRILGDTFRAAQIPFILLTLTLPLLTALVCLRLTGNPSRSFLAGLLAALPGYFLPYLLTTDAFALYAWLGTLAFLAMTEANRRAAWGWWVGAGLLVGLCHLTRADGVLLLAPAFLALLLTRRGRPIGTVGLLAGYGFVLAAWLARNLAATGSLMPAGTTRTLWLTSYDELFSFPASMLSSARWWNSGLRAILDARLAAAWSNLKTLVAVDGVILLGPFMALGAWRLRRRIEVWLGLCYLAALFLVMSFVFPFAGARGGFFHSGASVMPLLWALAPAGLDAAVGWVAARRRWRTQEAQRVLGLSAAGLVALVTASLFWSRVISTMPGSSAWGAGETFYGEVGKQIRALEVDPGIVAVNNPPGFYLATTLPAVVIPDGPPESLRQVLAQYRVAWVVLDANHPQGLTGVYTHPEAFPWLRLAATMHDPAGQPVLVLRVSLSVNPG
jgi:4-amino-4-deoxy-L-arabinose transferase-like glycosyltransferase